VAKGKLTKTVTTAVKKELYLAKQRKAYERKQEAKRSLAAANKKRSRIIAQRVKDGDPLSKKEVRRLGDGHRKLYVRLIEEKVDRDIEISDAEKKLSRFERYVMGDTGEQVVKNREELLRQLADGEIDETDLTPEVASSWSNAKRKQYFAAIHKSAMKQKREERQEKIDNHRMKYIDDTQTLWDSLVGRDRQVRFERLQNFFKAVDRQHRKDAIEERRKARVRGWRRSFDDLQSEFDD
jgi:hypothetical protein